MKVTELNQDQLEQLKWTYLYDTPNAYEYTSQIPNEVIFEHYAHISFVEEDFNLPVSDSLSGENNIREKAIYWFNNMGDNPIQRLSLQVEITKKYYPNRNFGSLTGREIEELYLKSL